MKSAFFGVAAFCLTGMALPLTGCGSVSSDSQGSSTGGAAETGGAILGMGGSVLPGIGGASPATGGASPATGGTGPAPIPTPGWFCTDLDSAQLGLGTACVCVPLNGPGSNSCKLPLPNCCFMFTDPDTLKISCQCWGTTQLTCPGWLSAVNGTQVAACPPP